MLFVILLSQTAYKENIPAAVCVCQYYNRTNRICGEKFEPNQTTQISVNQIIKYIRICLADVEL